MSDGLRVGVVGLRRGEMIARVFHSRPDARVTAVCDLNSERVLAAAERFGAKAFGDFGEMLASGIDSVVIATPPHSHCELSCLAVEAGVHVLCEVPAVVDFDEAGRLLETVRRARGTYMIAENVCFFANAEAMHGIVGSGRIGSVYFAEGEYVHDCRSLFADRDDGLGGGTEGRPSWRASLEPIRYCTHELGPILMITGDRIVEAVGFATGPRTGGSHGAIANEAALFRTESGGVVRLHAGFAVAREPAFHFLGLYGTAGSIETDRYRPYENLKAWFAELPRLGGLIDIPVSHGSSATGGHGASEYHMIDLFVRRLRSTERRSPGDEEVREFLGVEDALNMTMPGICAHLSAERGGAPVQVEVY